jgi:hypothetical protein
VEGNDWRLHGQQAYLAGARLRYAEYHSVSETWDHDHCAFCNRKVSDQVGEDVARAGWQTEDGYLWVCDTCFDDFREPLAFVAIYEGTPQRGVELHDSTILEVTSRFGVVVVALNAFVHDDRESASCGGCWQRIDLAFHEAQLERSGSGAARILDGSVRVDNHVTDNMLPIPFHETGFIVARLVGVDFELTLRALSVWLRVVGAPGTREG